MSLKTYGPGSELLPTDLNDIQDEYIDGVLTPWITIGGSVGQFYRYSSAQVSRGNITPANVQADLQSSPANTDFTAATYLDPADYPNSYNGTLRTLQLRLVATIFTTADPLGDITGTISLRAVTHSNTAGSFTLAAPIVTITPGTINATLSVLQYTSSPFTFPAAGLYTIEYLFAAVAGATGKASASVMGTLQRRAI